MELNMTVERVIEMYSNGLITDQECNDMLDTITRQHTTLKVEVDYDWYTEEMDHDYKWDVEGYIEYDL